MNKKNERRLWYLIYFILGLLVLTGISWNDLGMSALGLLFMLGLVLIRVDKLERKK